MKVAFLCVLLVGRFFLNVAGEDTVTFCIKATSTSNCSTDRSCQRCESLQYYFDTINATINPLHHLTMVFMPGPHSAHINKQLVVTVPILHMTGNGKANVTIRYSCDPYKHMHCGIFFKTKNISLINLTLLNWPRIGIDTIRLAMKNCNLLVHNVGLLVSNASRAILKNCTFCDIGVYSIELWNTTATFEHCQLHNSWLYSVKSNVIVRGDTEFCDCNDSALYLESSNITLFDRVLFANNTGLYGGTMFLYSSTMSIEAGAVVMFSNNLAFNCGGAIDLYLSNLYISEGASLIFINNSAYNKGGAVYVQPGITSDVIISDDLDYKCFHHLVNCNKTTTTTYISFINNSATYGGDDVYGASLHDCSFRKECSAPVIVNSKGMSSTSSDPSRVCLCDRSGMPQCNDMYLRKNLHPGETFTIAAVIVGWDFGTTTGIVYANYFPNSMDVELDSKSLSGHVISNVKKCVNISYSLFSSHTPVNVTMYVTAVRMASQTALQYIPPCTEKICNHTTPLFFNISLLPCPPGFTLINKVCDCYLHTILFDDCSVSDGTGYFSWSTNAWVNVTSDRILYNMHCPIDYCNMTKLPNLDLLDYPDSQCEFHRARTLCGGCRKNYSLAIGSSRCISCPDNNNLSLLLFFAAAGFLLVFFISALNLTVTDGMINGLIFYANIVWTDHTITFNRNNIYLKVFIAWLNLDFGIESCFVSGLNAFWKTWLEFVFPFYTAGLFVIGLTYSSTLSKLFGDRSVPTLATLLFLSYVKLLRTTIKSLELASLTSYPDNVTVYVWFVDGNLEYGKLPHITLLIASIACLLLLWLPYTMLLLLMQWVRRLPNSKISKWITQYKPLFDAYFAPLKDKHQYWFGVLLLVQGMLLLISSITANLNPAVSPFLLLVTVLCLFWYTNYSKVYKKKSVLILESAFFVNLIILVGGMLYIDLSKREMLVNISLSLAFVKFCGIVLWNVILSIMLCLRGQKKAQNTHDDKRQKIKRPSKRNRDIKVNNYVEGDVFRDSVLEDTPLLINDYESDKDGTY